MAMKYLALGLVEDWIRNKVKSYNGASVIWKALWKAYPLVRRRIAWKVGKKQQSKDWRGSLDGMLRES
jgi:hypothetical protein